MPGPTLLSVPGGGLIFGALSRTTVRTSPSSQGRVTHLERLSSLAD
ncbi:hypothetical protein [Streptomyces canus]